MKNRLCCLPSLKALIIALSLAFLPLAHAIPPEPEVGKRWVINPDFSDEFNGTKLDKTKWFDFHPNWRGRPPAKFDPAGVSVSNGTLQLKNQPLARPEGRFTMRGGAVVSRSKSAYTGYYEVRFLTSRISMSTTFWLSNREEGVASPNNLGEDCGHDRLSMELDIIEAVGGDFDQSWARGFRTQHHYNAHQFYRDCSGERFDFARSSNEAEGNGTESPQKELPNGRESWQDFNTYAAWWKDESQIDFYLNDIFSGRVNLPTDLFDAPFSRPMSMNMLTETYDWAQPYPTVDELNDDTINTSYYDWVRSYKLVDVQEVNLLNNGGFETGDFSNWLGWGGDPREVLIGNAHSGDYAAHVVGAGAAVYKIGLASNTEYTLTAFANVISGNLVLGVKNDVPNGQPDFGSVKRGNTAGQYEKVTFAFNTGNKNNVRLYLWAQAGSEFFIDDVTLQKSIVDSAPNDSTPLGIFDDTVTLKSHELTQTVLNYTYVYKADIDRLAKIVVKNNDIEISSKTVLLSTGYGHLADSIDLAQAGELDNTTFEIVMMSASDQTELDSTGEIVLTETAGEIVLMENNSFETGDFSSWTGWGGNPREVTVNAARSGDYGAHIVGAGGAEYKIRLLSNTEYRLTAYTNVISGSFMLGAKNNSSDGQPNFGAASRAAASGEYEKVEVTFNTGEFENVKLYMWTQAGGEFYLDDITLEKLN